MPTPRPTFRASESFTPFVVAPDDCDDPAPETASESEAELASELEPESAPESISASVGGKVSDNSPSVVVVAVVEPALDEVLVLFDALDVLVVCTSSVTDVLSLFRVVVGASVYRDVPAVGG